MSYDRSRKPSYGRDELDWEHPTPDYRGSGARVMSRKRSRSLTRGDIKRRNSPRKDKEMLDDNILSEISKLPEPNELWENNHGGGYRESRYPAPPPPPSFSREPVNPSYGSSYQPSYAGIYDDFPPLASAPPPPEVGSWNQMALPPPPAPSYHTTSPEDRLKKEAAIESEMRQQKAALSKQREDYIKKSAILKKEIDTLKDQRNELRGDPKRSPSPDTKRFLKENTKLQLEIQNKLKTINNVVDMLNGIIGEEAQDLRESDESPERKRKSRSPAASSISNKKVNYVYYDPEMHWCRVCNEFPPTAKDYLNHLHSVAHHKMAAQHMEAPWHSVSGINEGFPNYPSAPTKRTPIRGLQFFVPSTAWYCKLCDQFIGDLHCASAHLKSLGHSKNYTNFVEQNPHWETDWMSDRQKSFEKARSSGHKSKPVEEKPQYTAHTITFSKDGFHTKRPKKSPSPQPEEAKKKKRDKKKKSKKKRDSSSSSSSSRSDSSGSDSHKRKKKDKSHKQKKLNVADDKALEEWMSSIQADRLGDSDRKLLDSLKAKLKKERDDKQQATSRDIERVKEMQKKIRESERVMVRARDSERRRDEGRERDARREDRRDDSAGRRDAQRWERNDKRDDPPEKKPEVKKMPFIGKMPVYKHLGKTKVDEQKREEQKKKEETENLAKKKQEMDAEIQRKVAEFKEKIAAAALERQQQQTAARLGPPPLAIPSALGAAAPPPLALPTSLGAAAPPLLLPHPPQPHKQPIHQPPPPVSASAPALPKDFQEALDIIFPADQPPNDKLKQDAYIQPPSLLGMPPNMGNVPNMGNISNMGSMTNMPMQAYAAMGMMQPPSMFGFDLSAGLFPQPQLYDSHVPIMPNNQQKQQPSRSIKINRLPNNNKKLMKLDLENEAAQQKSIGDAAAKKQEEMDDLAMLGIDASDVGAGI